MFKDGYALEENERWVHLVYPLGLFFIVISYIMIFLFSNTMLAEIGIVWLSVPLFVLSIGYFLFLIRLKPDSQYA